MTEEAKQECSICCEGYLKLQEITSECKHNDACPVCIKRHIEAELNSKGDIVQVRCPKSRCTTELTFDDVRRLATKELFERYDTLLLRNAIRKLPDFRWCKAPKCGSGQEHTTGDRLPIMTCSACSAKSCFTHDVPWHQGLTCAQFTEQLESKDYTANRAYYERLTKQCPSCQMSIEKNQGCDHMRLSLLVLVYYCSLIEGIYTKVVNTIIIITYWPIDIPFQLSLSIENDLLRDYKDSPSFMPNMSERPRFKEGLAKIKDEDLFKEINKVPLFMTELLEDEREENADFNQGNECFKSGKLHYQDAINFYTKALDTDCKDNKMIEACLTNRAAINLELFLNDCAKALKINLKNTKAFYQSAKALYMLDKLDEALGCCDHALLYKESDFVAALNEDTTFLDYLEVIFENPAPRGTLMANI
ncbi:2313_t:CDS:2, partial [Entrophospora sp. SA101]